MKIFLFFINTIIGMDEWIDRKLVFEVNNLSESDGKLCFTVDTDEPISFRKLNPMKSYALQFEYPNGEKELKYFTLRGFEIGPPIRGSTVHEVTLHVKRVEVEV
jgi:hypothetical protein